MKTIAVWWMTVLAWLAAFPAGAASKYFSYDAATNVWNTSSAFWGTVSGGPYDTTWSSNDAAFFEGAAGIVTLSAAQTAQGITFSTGGYVLSNSVLTLTSPAIVSNEMDAAISSIVASPVGLTKAGAGTLALSGVNSYTNATTIAAGTLTISGTGRLGNGAYAGVITNNARLVYSSTAAQTFSGVISGAGSLSKDGAGTLTLTAANTFTGSLAVNGGTLSFNSIGNVGTTTGSALGKPASAANGTIGLAGTLVYSGAAASSDRVINLTGGASIIQSGTGTLTLTGGITGTGNLVIWGSQAITESGTITINGTLLRTNNGTLTLSNAANSFGNVTVNDGIISVNSIANAGVNSALGAGTTISIGQSGFNTFGTLRFTGVTGGSSDRAIIILSNSGNVNGGIIESAVSGQRLTLSGGVTTGGTGTTPTLQLTGIGDGVMSGDISGTGLALTKTGSGAWTLSGSNTFTGGMTVSAGTLAVGSDSAAGGGTVTMSGGSLSNSSALVTLGNAIVVNTATTNTISSAAGNLVLRGIISGTGLLMKSGAGTLTLTGSNTFSGATTVASGILQVNNASGSGLGSSAAGVTSGGTLGGTGVVNGVVTVNTGAKVAAGSGGIGTLTVGSLVLNAGGLVDVELDLSGGQTNDQIVVSGSLTFNGGGFNLYQVGTTTPFTTPGTYNLIQYSGAIGGAGFHILAVANPVAGLSYSFNVAGGWVTVTIGRQVNWNGGGGDDNWMTDANWSGGSHPVADDALLFGDSGASRVSNINDLDAYTRIAGITFANDSYTLNGAPIILANNIMNTTNLDQTINVDVVLNDSPTVDTGSGTLALNGVLSETNEPCEVTKAGAGILILTNANTYSGGTVINAGTLKVNNGAGSATGSGNVTVNSGAVLGGNGLVAGAVTVNTGAVVAAGNGVGSLALGSLTLAAGCTNIVEFDPVGSNDVVVIAGGLTNNGCAVRLVTNGTMDAWAQTGTYMLFQFSGTLGGVGLPGFTVVNPVAGLTYYFTTNGTALQVIIGGSPIWTGGGVDENWQTGGNWGGVAPAPGSTLIFNTSNWLVNSNDFAAGTPFAIVFTNTAGPFTLTGNPIDLSGDVVNLGTNTQTINLGLNLAGSSRAVNASVGAMTINGVIGGGFGLTKSGTNTVTLSATNSYSGTTTIGAGTLALTGGDNRLPANTTVAFAGSGTLSMGGVSQTLANFTVANNVTGNVSGGGGTLMMGASNFYVGGAAAQTLSLSGLDVFSFSDASKTFEVSSTSSATATLTLARTNTISTSTFSVADRGAGNNISETGILNLGAGRTTINAGYIYIGWTANSAGGHDYGYVRFQAGGGTLVLRNTAGTGRITQVMVGRLDSLSYTTGASGNLDLSLGSVDALVGDLYIGYTSDNNGGNMGVGTVILGAGLFDVSNINIGSTGGGTAGSGGLAGTLTLTNGGTLAADYIRMSSMGGGGATRPDSTINLNGGATLAVRSLAQGTSGGIKTFNWNNGTIKNSSTNTDLTISAMSSCTFSLLGGGLHAFDIGSGRTGTVNVVMSGAGALTKSGDGVLNLATTNTYTGGTIVSAGKLRLAVNGAVSQGTPLTMNGGTLDPVGYTNTFSTLTVGPGTSTLLIGAVPLSFTNSSAVSWSGNLNLVGALGPTSLRFGTSHGGLTSTQVQLMNYSGRRVDLDPSGYVVLATGTLIMIK